MPPSLRRVLQFLTPGLLVLSALAQPAIQTEPTQTQPSPPPLPTVTPANPNQGPMPMPAPGGPVFTPSQSRGIANPDTNERGSMVGPITFGEVTIDGAISLYERWSGRTALRPNALPSTSIALALNQAVTKAEALRVLETLLSMNGIAVAPLGDKFVKITPLNLVRTEAPEFLDGSTLELPPSGRVVSKLFELQFLRVSEFMPQMAGLLSAGAASPPVLFEKANAALVTDTITNLQRIETLAAKLDKPALAGLSPKFYRITSTTAGELVTKLQSILSGAATTHLGTGTTFQADDRTNQIILLSDPRQHALFDDLIAKLDTAGESSTRQEVIPLKHANATEVATVLSTLISGQMAATRTATQANQAQQASRAALGGLRNQGGQNAAMFNAAGGLQATQGNPGNNQQANIAAQQAAQAARAAAQGGGPITISGPGGTMVLPFGPAGGTASVPQQFSTILTVVPDERSNALVVSGTVDDIRLINELVAKLDVLLAQVRIEVVIAEVTLGDGATSGISALGLTIQNDRLVAFSGSGPGISVPTATITPGVVGSGPYDLAATVNLTTTPRKSNARILSVPNIITTHNKEGRIFVGEERPVISSYLNDNTGGQVGGTGYRSTVSSKEIGIELVVKPLIGNDGSVQLEVTQEVSDVLGEITVDGNPQPRVGRRSTASFVSVKSGEILVLGGLQRTTATRSTSRLGPIPIIGDIFGTRSRDSTRTDLVFFLRPYVLTNTPADNAEALQRLQTSPQRQDVESALQGAPLAGKR